MEPPVHCAKPAVGCEATLADRIIVRRALWSRTRLREAPADTPDPRNITRGKR
jgi:hypothetical protein